MRTEQSASLKFYYPVVVRITGFAGIALLISMFMIFPRAASTLELDEEVQIVIEQIDIPQTEQFDSEDIAEDVTLDEFNLDDFDAWDAPPPPPEGPRVKFIPYDDPPVPLSPIRPKYPEIAQEAGIEGTVVVQVFVDDKGRVRETLILKGIPNTGLDEAASNAIRTVRFRPAKQRERAVGVWISIPVNFRLKS